MILITAAISSVYRGVSVVAAATGAPVLHCFVVEWLTMCVETPVFDCASFLSKLASSVVAADSRGWLL
jgi:hypothetical protein